MTSLAPRPPTRSRRIVKVAASLAALGGFGVVGFFVAPAVEAPKERPFTVRAHKYGYEPERLRVNLGDKVRLKLESNDVVHGFFLEGHDLDATIVPLRGTVELRHPSQPGVREDVAEVTFTADHEGKFRYRCSQTCGFLHPFMQGELVVGPNRLLPVALALVIGMLVVGFITARFPARPT
jgi:plastocyanin